MQWQDAAADPVHRPAAVPPRKQAVAPVDQVGWDIDWVRSAVAAVLVDRAPDITLVAKRLRTSRRTLQRRLQGSGLTFGGLVAEVRRQTAERLLRDRARKIADVARTLGYSDPAHFTRAFSRWTGVSPRRFRNEPGPERAHRPR